jgi:hypothetical protein
MKFNFSSLLPLAAISLIASQSAQAIQPVPAPVLTSGFLNLDGSNILNLGPVLYAYNLDDSGAGTTTLNGVTFVGINSNTTSSPDFSITNSGGYDTTLNKDGSGTAIASGDPLFLLQNRGAFNNLTLTLDNLTPGTEYAAQLEIGEQVSDNRFQQYVDGSSASPLVSAHAGPQYILDTFTATGTSETLVAQVGGGGGAQLTGFVVESVPEPSTWAMMGLAGLVFLGVSRRARFNS